MQVTILGNPEYGELSVRLDPGETITTEAGAMSRMSPSLEMRSRVMGGVVSGLGRKLFGGESFFVAEYGGARGGQLSLSPGLPGTVCHQRISGDVLWLTAGSFLACTAGVTVRARFGGVKALFSGEGATLLRAEGEGDLWFNAYGAVVERELDGELTVDTGHVVAWEPSINYTIAGFGGLKSTFFSGEGLTMKFSGRGKVWLQSRNLPATGGWLSPFCVG
ncbi:MAG: TIGR00266 family protein [Planctomycetota bacterium]